MLIYLVMEFYRRGGLLLIAHNGTDVFYSKHAIMVLSLTSGSTTLTIKELSVGSFYVKYMVSDSFCKGLL